MARRKKKLITYGIIAVIFIVVAIVVIPISIVLINKNKSPPLPLWG
jgi:t-SNARE complex subunit (syntaxin)